MERFINYINAFLPDMPGDDIQYAFKRKTLDEMNQRFAEVSTRGVGDKTVLEDLILSEHPDLGQEYAVFRNARLKARRQKKFAKRNVIGSVLYLLALVGLYLFVSFVTHAWDVTWFIIVDGVLLWVVYLLGIGVAFFTSLRKIFHVFARICLAGAVIVGMVALYLFVVAVADLPHGWLIVIVGLIFMFMADGVFAVAARHRLAIISWLIYIPVIATFLFIIIGVLHLLPWGVAWIIIPLSLILDVVIIVMSITKNKLERMEVTDAWSEN